MGRRGGWLVQRVRHKRSVPVDVSRYHRQQIDRSDDDQEEHSDADDDRRPDRSQTGDRDVDDDQHSDPCDQRTIGIADDRLTNRDLGSRWRGSLIYTSFCRYGLSEDHIATTPHDINRFRIAALSLDDYAAGLAYMAGLAHDAGQSVSQQELAQAACLFDLSEHLCVPKT